MRRAATLAHPLALRQPQPSVLTPTVVTETRTRIEPIHLNKRPPIPLCLIGELIHETAPPVSEDATVHRPLARLTVVHGLTIITQLLLRLPRHIPHRQSLHANELVIFDQSARQLVLEVFAVATNLSVCLRYNRLLLAVVARTLHPARQLTLFPHNLLLQLAEPVRIVDLLTRRQGKEVFDAQVDTNLSIYRRFGLNIHVEQENQIVVLVLSFHRPTRERFEWVSDTVSPTDANRPKFLGQRVPITLHTAYRCGVTKRLNAVALGRETGAILPILRLAEIRCLRLGDIEITDTLTNYDSANTWSGDKATASFPLADPNDIADSPIIFNPGDYRSHEYLHLLGGKYELEMAGFIDYPWQVQYGDLDNPDAVNVRGYVTFPSRNIYHIRRCGESYTLRNCIEYGYGGTIECRDEGTLKTWLNNLPADLREAVNAATRAQLARRR